MYGVAMRLAQSLGLHKLSYDPEIDSLNTTIISKAEKVRRREMGGRAFILLRMHDMFALAFTDMYFIHESHCKAALTRRIQDEDLSLCAESEPHYADWSIWLFQLADLVAQCHKSILADHDDERAYRSMLEFDAKIRAHDLPAALLIDSDQPWVRWARQEAIIVRANKIGYIHRRFFRKSFANERFAYSRWASVESARATVRQVEAAWVHNSSRPRLWNDESHLIGACVTLCLDTLGGRKDDTDSRSHEKLLDCAVSLLRTRTDSIIATKGIRLISALMTEDHEQLARALTNQVEEEALYWPLVAEEDLEIVHRRENIPVHASNGENAFTSATPTEDQDDIFSDLSWINMLGDNTLPGIVFDTGAALGELPM